MTVTEIPEFLVHAAIAAAEETGQDVANVSLSAIAAKAGVSRSTLLRRIGGSRRTLDQAVRAAGVDPGGRPPARERAVNAAARLIAERGLAALTMEAVASTAQCSVPSLHESLGGRDALLTAVFERHIPLLDLNAVLDDSPDLGTTVRTIYRTLVIAFDRQPRVLPSLFADVISRPDGPAGQVLRRYMPQFLSGIGSWLEDQMETGRIRRMPVPVAAQLLIAPVVVHVMSRPAIAGALGTSLPTVEDACEVFAQAFLRAAVPS
ncbi:TetR/AcrR family transcriptional regulator [Nonomuraea sp. B5E05]|uniref:TetR/AcrR family transcriptional regulator n=1 Tax=Nonomuraea sp. B5E05 TaxID=3153569 RepID=UPI0032608E31